MKKKCKFGHPLKKNNRKNGKCGTCLMAKEFRETAKDLSNIPANGALKVILNDLASIFEKGDVIYDTEGQTLSEVADSVKKGK
jgi:hypothetical protein